MTDTDTQDASAEHDGYRVVSHMVRRDRPVLNADGHPKIRMQLRRSKDGRRRLEPTPVTERVTTVREQLVSEQRDADRALGRGVLSGRQWRRQRKARQRAARVSA